MVRLGSLFWTVFQPAAPTRFEEVDASRMPTYGRLHRALIDRGVYLAPSGWEVGFVSAAHDDADIDATIAAVGEAMREIAD